MFRKTLIVSFSVLFLCFGCSTPTVKAEDKRRPDTVAFRRHEQGTPGLKAGTWQALELVKLQKTPYDSLHANWKDTSYVATYKGKLFGRTSTQALQALADIHAEFMVDKLFLIRAGQDVVLFWQETDHEGENTYVARFKPGTEKPLWKLRFTNRPNLSVPVIDGQTACISMLGLVGRLNLSTGVFDWKYDDLFDTHQVRFARFSPALVYDSLVVFAEIPRNSSVIPDSIRVRSRDGVRIVR